MTTARYSKIIEVLNQRQPDLAVVTDSVHKGKNLSAIIRTCDAVGVLDLYSVSQNDFLALILGPLSVPINGLIFLYAKPYPSLWKA